MNGSRALLAPRRGPPAHGLLAARALALASVALAAAACTGRPASPPFRLDAALDGGAELALPAAGRVTTAAYHQEERRVVELPLATWSWRGRVPAGARLELGAQLRPDLWERFAVSRLDLQIEAIAGGRREVLDALHATGKHRSRYWLDTSIPLDAYAGREVELVVTPFAPELAGNAEGAMVWGPVALTVPPPVGEPPNVLFVLIDTLRHDHLGLYGYPRPTSPILDALAAAGTVFEDAYAPAPWTLPSLVGLFSGRYPSEVLGADPATFALPAEAAVLPELMASQGYRTAGFIANPTLHAGNGFGRGFSTLYRPVGASDSELLQLHAEEISSRASSWLAAHQSERFFAYLHFIDPHDPYENPDIVAQRSPFLPDYAGPINGRHVHGLHVGRVQMPDPERDREQLVALYDAEIRYVDRHLGEVLAALRPEVLARTLIVVTSDHGEELLDHGGFKHGQTLYEEQIHVPLIVRWDGRVAAGRRVAGTVRLLDLVPTLVGIAGGEPSADWDGVDLGQVLLTGAAVPRRPAYAQHLTAGPWRAAAVLDRRKLMVFNGEEAFDPGDNLLQQNLYALDRGRLARSERYDLAADPAERERLPPAAGEGGGPLWSTILAEVDASLPGLRLLATGLEEGSRLSGILRFDRPLDGLFPFLLSPGDRCELRGNEVTFDLGAESLAKGALLRGDWSTVTVIALARNGVPLAAAAGAAGPLAVGVGVNRAAVTGNSPVDPTSPLWLWEPPLSVRVNAAPDPETLAKLKALGYLE